MQIALTDILKKNFFMAETKNIDKDHVKKLILENKSKKIFLKTDSESFIMLNYR